MSSHHPLRTNSVTYCSTPFELRMCAGQSKTAAKSDVDNVDVEGKCPTSNIVAACPQAHPILVGNKTGGRKKLKTHTRSWPKGKKGILSAQRKHTPAQLTYPALPRRGSATSCRHHDVQQPPRHKRVSLQDRSHTRSNHLLIRTHEPRKCPEAQRTPTARQHGILVHSAHRHEEESRRVVRPAAVLPDPERRHAAKPTDQPPHLIWRHRGGQIAHHDLHIRRVWCDSSRWVRQRAAQHAPNRRSTRHSR
jgi:hypothetical protein